MDTPLQHHIAIIGDENRRAAVRARLAPHTHLKIEEAERPTRLDLSDYGIILHLNLDDDPEVFFTAPECPCAEAIVIGCAVKRSLAQMVAGRTVAYSLFGLNALPYFIEAPKWEVSALHAHTLPQLHQALQLLGIEGIEVADRIGMVTTRSLFAIINEAFFMAEEGGAAAADIDFAMKLGVNYPFGPFEWAEKIGIRNIFEVLENLRKEAGYERYRPAESLRRQYYLAQAAQTNS